MAYSPPKAGKPVTIDKWLGVNEGAGEIEQQLGEAVYQRNFRITKNKKAEKRYGHTTYFDESTASPNNYGWQGTIDSVEVIVCESGLDVYQLDIVNDTSSVIGTVLASVTDMFYYDSLLFIMADKWYTWDGTTFGEASVYIPTVEIGGEYDGSGAESFEERNLFTDEIIVQRLGDGTNTVFTLLFDVTAVNSVEVDGVAQTFTFSSPRTVTITSGTPADNSLVDIECELGDDLSSSVLDNTNSVLFGADDGQVFLWGADNNTVRFSGLSKPTYFAVSAFSYVGTDDYPINDMKPINDRLIAFKTNEAKYTYAQLNPLYSDNVGLNKYSFEFFNVNDKYGSQSTVEVIEETPISLDGGAFQRWYYQSVVNNVDPSNISDRIRDSLENVDLSTAVTFNYKRLKEYWVNIDDIVYIYNYGTDVFYMFDNIEATWFIETDDNVYYGTNTGEIERFDDSLNDNGTAILARLELGFTAYGVEDWEKNAFYGWVTLAAKSRTSITVKYATDEDNEATTENFYKKYVLFDYGNIDYGDFSYATNRNPQTNPFKLKIKKFQYIKYIFENEELDEECLLLTWKTKPTMIKEVR